MLKHPEARAVTPVDSRGELIWDDAKNGQFVLIVVKIDKDQGLLEFGRVQVEGMYPNLLPLEIPISF